MDCGCIDNNIDTRDNVGCFLSVKDGCTFGSKGAGKIGFFGIGSGNLKSFLKQYFRESTHTDTADSDKVYMDRLIKV